MHSHLEAPSDWVVRWAPLVTRGPVLDVASGAGRHARFFAARGFEVVAVDRDEQQIPETRFVRADLENGSPWPFAGQRFGAIVVTNYLHRPLMPLLEQALDAQGVLIYETFMLGNERLGKPSNPSFLLKPGELLHAFSVLTLVAFEQGTVERPKKAAIQRACLIRDHIERAKIVA